MSTYEEREKAFEAKFANDQELKFKIESLRSKKVGLWAAEQMGIVGDEALEYAKSVIRADFEEAGDEDVFRKVRADFDTNKVSKSDSEIRDELARCLAEAEQELVG